MPKTEQHYMNLPPAKLSEQQLQEIDDALPPYFQGNLSWIVVAGTTRITEDTVKKLFKSIEGVQGITEFSLMVEVEDATDVTLDLFCEERSSLSYSCPPEKSGELQQLARIIVSIFRENKRRGWWLPWVRTPKLEFGEQPKPRFTLSWNRIIENVITNWLSYLLISLTMLVLGFFLGKILG